MSLTLPLTHPTYYLPPFFYVPLGDRLSEFTMRQIAISLEKHPQLSIDPVTALTETFVNTNQALLGTYQSRNTYFECPFNTITIPFLRVFPTYLVDNSLLCTSSSPSRLDHQSHL